MRPFRFTPPGYTTDDRLWAALVYFTAPLGPLVALRLPERQASAFVRAHTWQALGFGLLVALAVLLLYGPSYGLSVVLFVFDWRFAYRAYCGEEFAIPILTEFLKNRGWI